MTGGRELRLLTRRAISAHGGGRGSDVFGDVYMGLLAVAVGTSLLFGVATEFAAGMGVTAEAGGQAEWFAWVVLIAVLGSLIGLTGRLGPIFLSAGYAAWWLPAPVDRRGLLRPRLMGVIAVALAAGALTGVPVSILAGGDHLTIVPSVALLAGLGTAAGAATQMRGRHIARIGDALLPVAVLPFALAGFGAGPWTGPVPGWAIGAGVVALCLVVVLADRGMEALSGADLRSRGMLAIGLQGAATSFDTRELGFLLGAGDTPRPRRGSRRLRAVRSTVSGIIVSEGLLFVRTRRHVVQFALGGVIAAAGGSTWFMVVMLIAGALISSSALAGAARSAYQAPVLDGIWPAGQRAVRWARLILPSTAMAIWTAVVLGFLVGVIDGWWIALGAASGPVFAAGMIRSAYRAPADWSAPLITTPDGQAIPPGAFSAVSKGMDVIVLCTLPLLLGLITLGAHPGVVLAQVAATMIALVAARNTNTKRAT